MSSKKTCPHCGGTTLVEGVKLSLPASGGNVGLEHRKALVFTVVEMMLADLCKDCGTITRLYVNNPDHDWITG